MAFLTHPSVEEIIQVAGYLFWNPTNLAAEATWGTKLGFCEGGIVFQSGHSVIPVTQEETGPAVYKVVYVGSRPTLFAVLKNYNSTLLSTLFPGMTTSTAAKFPSTIRPGTDLSGATYSQPLLFVPQDTTNHPCVLLQKGCPNIVQAAKLKLSHSDRTTFPVVFNGLPKTTDADGTAYFGLLSGAVLR